MFGQSKPAFATGTFGQTSAFGSTTPFGAGANSTFGAKTTGTTAFGTPGGFGAQTPASTGLFGTTNTPTAAGGLFGGASTAFGQNTQNTGFSGFGAQQTSQAGGLFGATTHQGQGSIFGTPTASSSFGSKTPASGFGGTTQNTGMFGASNTAGTSLFGGTGTTASGGMFGGTSAFGSGVSGTTIKFNPPTGTDTMMKGGVSQSLSTRHQCISAMKEYENKSLEELRFEDYAANRKGAQGGASAGGMFGATQNQAQTQNTAFGGFTQQQQNKPAGFGGFGATSTSGGLFGQQSQPATSSLFGTNTANKPLFGSTATTSASSGFTGFGTNTSASGNLFGQNNQQKPLFGTATTQSGGLFGQTPASSAFGGFGGFGTNTTTQSTGGIFGKTGFGTATSNTGLGFGQQNTGLFANKPAASNTGFNFGQTGSTGFGTQQNTGGLFGAKAPGFGTNTGTLGGSTGFGTLGSGLGTSSSLFSGQQNKTTLGLGTTFGTSAGLGSLGGNTLGGALNLMGTVAGGLGSADAAVVAQQAQIQQQLLALANSPYGDSPLFMNLKQDDNKREEALKPTNPAAQKAALTAANQYKVSPRPTAKIKPKPIHSLNGKSQLFEGLEEEESTFGNDTFVPRKSIKKLVIKSQNSPNVTSLNQSSLQTDDDLMAPSPIMPTLANGQRSENHILTPAANGDASVIRGAKALSTSAELTPVRGPYGRGVLDDTITALNSHNRSEDSRGRLDSTGDDPRDDDEEQNALPHPPHPAGVVLHRPEYYTLPSLDELASMVDENGDCIVNDFVVGRYGYGNVFFPGETNVAGLNLDEIVHFRRKEITVYPDDTKKPPDNEGLNKKAQVTLDCVWPNDKTLHSPIKSPQRLQSMGYQEKIEQASAKIGAKFIDYRPETGSWVFEVRHFSKYGLVDDSDDEAEDISKDPKKLKVLQEKSQQQLAIQKQRIAVQQMEQQAAALASGAPVIGQTLPVAQRKVPEMDDMMIEEDDDSDMADIGQEKFPEIEMSEDGEDRGDGSQVPSSHRLANRLGVNAHSVQVMKASFYGEDDADMDIGTSFVGDDKASRLPMRGLGGPALGRPSMSGLGLMAPPSQPSDMYASDTPSLASLKHNLLSSTATHQLHYQQQQSSPLRHSFIYDRVQRQSAARPAMKQFAPAAPEHILLPSGLTAADKPRGVAASRVHRAVPALEDSVMVQRHHLNMDAALVHGRSCRVGWGPGMTLVHCGSVINKRKEDTYEQRAVFPSLMSARRPQLEETPHQVVLEKINITGYSTEADPALKNMLEKTLEIHLKQSQRTLQSGCPIFAPMPGVTALHRCAQQAEEDTDRVATHPYADTVHHTRLVWDLCVALWGQLNDFIDSEDVDQNSHAHHMARREAFSKWLTLAASSNVNREVNDAKIKGRSHLVGVMSYMSAGRVSEACSLAQDSGDHRLALLLAQAAGSNIVRRMVAKQLANWQEQKADQLMDPDRVRLYAMVAGELVWPSSLGDVNVCENVDWKRCLAIHLWYMCTPTASVSEALHAYDKAFLGHTAFQSYAAKPLPPYLEESVDADSIHVDERYVVRDTCYHLLKLYSDRSHRLERILTPTTSTPNHLDFTLSWHLMRVLTALEYSHLSEYARANLTCGFAAQLEALGLWHWAVFVLLHLEDRSSREHAVRSLLGHHISLSRDADYIDREHFVQERLLVAPSWIHEAKAQRAHAEGRAAEEAWHLLKSGLWNEAHNVLLRSVASDAIINERYGYLKRYLREMVPLEYSASIQDWATGGKVFYDYIMMVEALEEIKQAGGDINAYELERLQPDVISLCSRIGNLPCRSAKDRLCQSEMAKRTANLLKMLVLLQQEARTETGYVTSSRTRLLAPHISKLPLPEDYALQELRDLTRSYMIELTS